jgi:hypothetical protein
LRPGIPSLSADNVGFSVERPWNLLGFSLFFAIMSAPISKTENTATGAAIWIAVWVGDIQETFSISSVNHTAGTNTTVTVERTTVFNGTGDTCHVLTGIKRSARVVVCVTRTAFVVRHCITISNWSITNTNTALSIQITAIFWCAGDAAIIVSCTNITYSTSVIVVAWGSQRFWNKSAHACSAFKSIDALTCCTNITKRSIGNVIQNQHVHTFAAGVVSTF